MEGKRGGGWRTAVRGTSEACVVGVIICRMWQPPFRLPARTVLVGGGVNEGMLKLGAVKLKGGVVRLETALLDRAMAVERQQAAARRANIVSESLYESRSVRKERLLRTSTMNRIRKNEKT